jgi:hypothetical protein
MADNREDFEVWLKSRYDGDAMKAAQADFKRTQAAAKKTDESFKDMGYSADALKQQLTGLLAFTTVVAQFREGFEQVAALEQAMNQLERATKRNGDNFDVVKGKIVGMADALKKAAGVDDDAAIKKMVSLYNATGDVANAMNLVALAADVAVGSGLKFEQASDLVTKAATGEVGELKRLGITIDENGTKTDKATRGLDALQKTFGGAANGAKGLKVELDRLNESYEDMRNSLVEKLTPAIEIAMNLIKSFFVALDGAWRLFSDAVVGTLGFFGKFGSYMKALLSGDLAGMKAAVSGMGAEVKGTYDSMVAGAEATKKKIADIWTAPAGGGVKAGKPTGIVTPGGGGGSALAEQINEWQQEMNRWHQLQGALNLAFLKKKLADEKKHEDAKLALRKHGAKETERIEKQLDAERERLMDAQTQRILDQVRLTKASKDAEKAMAIETAYAAIGLGQAMFGDSKELAIASAIINTYEGASKALAQGGIYGPVLAAIVIATGMAQVAKITSTEPSGGDATRGQGFDNPSSDAAARLGGRRWAADMIGEFTGGVREGWAAGMMGGQRGGSTTNYDQRRTYNVHLHGAGLIDPSNQQMLLQLKRNLDMVGSRVDSQRTLARAAR